MNEYELRNNPDLAVPIVKSVHIGLESLNYLGPKIWELLPLETCRIWKIYLQNVGFL